MSENIIETIDLTRQYGKTTVVNQINLSVKRGDIYGFLGPNGAGKTTTIRMLLGLIRPTSGEINVFNQNLAKNRIPILKKVGSLVESPSYYGHLTGTENLEVLRRILGVPKSKISEVLEIVRLSKVANRPVKGYSLGMKQRLGIAASLLGNPELLILDEPTNGLDPAGIHEIRELIKEMPHKYGITVVVSSHLLSEIDQMATKVGIIHRGSLIFQDSIEALRKQSLPQIRFKLNQPFEALHYLKELGIPAFMENGFLWTDEIEDQKLANIINLFVHRNISIYRVEEMKPSLEDIFLTLVGEGTSL